MADRRHHGLMIDADQHYYEPDDAFTRHLEPQFRDRAPWIDRANRGMAMLGSQRQGFFSVGVADHIGPPGMLKEYLRHRGEFVLPNVEPQDGLAEPTYTDRAARAAVLADYGVVSAFMLPTWGVGVEPELRHDPASAAAVVRAFNRWVEEDWGFDDSVLLGAAVLTLIDPSAAAEEVSRLRDVGCRLVCVTPGPAGGLSPADPVFDPVWATMAEASMLVVHHIGATPMTDMYGTGWGERAHPPSHRQSAMEMYLGFGERPVTDTWAAMYFHNLFGRHPGLQVVSIENGAGWVPYWIDKMAKLTDASVNKDSWRFGRPDLDIRSTFSRNFSVVPFFEDDIAAVVAACGADRVLAGSDFPHPEGLAEPLEFADELTALTDDQRDDIMWRNAARLLGRSVVEAAAT